MFKYGVFSGAYFLVFGLNTGKYGPEKTPYLDTFHTVWSFLVLSEIHLVKSHISKQKLLKVVMVLHPIWQWWWQSFKAFLVGEYIKGMKTRFTDIY